MRSRSWSSMGVGRTIARPRPAHWITTLSNEQVAVAPVAWLVTARPTYTVVPIAIVSVPTRVQFTPSADSYALNRLPFRCNFTHRGAAESDPAVLALTPLSVARRWNAMPFEADASMNA